MKVFIGQPGAFGDILICAPIAKHYADQGHDVFWPIGTEHLSLVEQFSYVTPIPLPKVALVAHSDPREVLLISRVMMGQSLADEMGAVYLNLADRPNSPRLENETIEEKKYRVAEVPFEEKYTLSWTRNKEKEDSLFNLLTLSGEYTFAHLDQSDGTSVNLECKEDNMVKCVPVEGYNILDWYKVIVNASEIYCIESSLGAFVDGLGDKVSGKKFLLSTKGNKFVTKFRGWEKLFR
jgi:hypothetical protein